MTERLNKRLAAIRAPILAAIFFTGCAQAIADFPSCDIDSQTKTLEISLGHSVRIGDVKIERFLRENTIFLDREHKELINTRREGIVFKDETSGRTITVQENNITAECK